MDPEKRNAQRVAVFDVQLMVQDDDGLYVVDLDTEYAEVLTDRPVRRAWRVYVSWWIDGLRSSAILRRVDELSDTVHRSELRAACRAAELAALTDRKGRKVTVRDLAAQRRPSDGAHAPPELAYLLGLGEE
jgi:hypothetical protein